MRIKVIIAAILVFLPFSSTVQAVAFFERVQMQYRRPATRTYTYPRVQPYRSVQPQPTYRTRSTNDNCLYYNTQGECMIEQYYSRTPSYYRPRTYDEDDLYNECRRSGRSTDDDDRFDCNYFNDDDDDRFYSDDDDSYDDDDDEWEDIKDDFFDDDDDSDDDDDD